MFCERVQDPYGIYREPDFDNCNSKTARNGFDYLRNRPQFNVGDQTPIVLKEFLGQTNVPCAATHNDDWGYNPDEVEKYFACYDYWMAETVAELQRALAGSGTVYDYGMFGKSYGDSFDVGGDMFGASLAFATEWHVRNLTTQIGDYCQMQPDFNASFNATARALYMNVPLISAQGEFKMRPAGQGGYEKASVQILDQAVVGAYGDLTPETFNVVTASDSLSKNFFYASATFVVVVVPVTIAGGAAGQVGTAVSVGGGLPANSLGCAGGDMETTGAFRPFAGVGAFADASVDLVIASAGVKAYLTLLSIELPYTVNLDFQRVTGRVDPDLAMDINLDLALSVLGGYLSAYVEICYVFDCSDYETPIFSWDGPHFRRNLYSRSTKNLGVWPLQDWLERQGG
jgi:hypothetical protein